MKYNLISGTELLRNSKIQILPLIFPKGNLNKEVQTSVSELVDSGLSKYVALQLTMASVHDVNVLKEIKYGKMSNATLIGDKGYISKEVKIDLFESCNIKLETPARTNQRDQEHWHPIFRKCRKRIETLFSRL